MVKLCIFLVLPFGLNSASFLFTKIVHALIKYWHKHLIKITFFLDEGLNVAESFSKAISNSQFAQDILQKSSFIVNCKKSVREPKEVMIRLGITLDVCMYVKFI